MKKAQRSILMKKTVSYNIKKVLAGTMLVALPFAFGGCEKDPVKPENNKPKIARLVFDKNGHHIELDTIRYYLAQGFDSIYMIANPSDMFVEIDNIHNATLFLQDRVNLSSKVRGKDKLEVNKYTNPTDRQQLSNMGFTVVVNNDIKSR